MDEIYQKADKRTRPFFEHAVSIPQEKRGSVIVKNRLISDHYNCKVPLDYGAGPDDLSHLRFSVTAFMPKAGNMMLNVITEALT